MLGSRAILSAMLARLSKGLRPASAPQSVGTLDIAGITTIIHNRELQGLPTTLRQLHSISDLSQPEALSLIDRMAKAGIVSIETNLGDAFESRIMLSDETRLELERASDRSAA